MERMTVTVKVTDGWMVKVLAKQIHTMKWNGRAPGVIVQRKQKGTIPALKESMQNVSRALNRAFYGEERKVL